MGTLSAEDILTLWDSCSRLKPATRALELLARGEPQADPAEHAGLPLGTRDARILAIRVTAFGERLEIQAQCEECGTLMVLSPTAAELGFSQTLTPPSTKDLFIEGQQVRIRPVTAGDTVAVENAGSIDAARAQLLARCVLSIDGEAVEQLPEHYGAPIEDELRALDPQASVIVQASCPDCDSTWQAPFDAASFLWQEINHAAPRLLHEVSQLALNFHWSERDILAMSAARRSLYLEAAAK